MTYRNLFDEAIGTPPLSTVDIDEVVARQRRAAIARPLVGTFAAVALVAGGSAVAASALTGEGPSVSHTPAASTTPPTSRPRSPETSIETASRLSQALVDNFYAMGEAFEVRTYDPAARGLFWPSDWAEPSHHYLADLIVGTPVGTARMTIEAFRVYGGPTPTPTSSGSTTRVWPPTDCSNLFGDKEADWHCWEQRGPGGSRVLFGDSNTGGHIEYLVVVLYPDSSYMSAQTYNERLTSPVLSLRQMVTLVADEDLKP